MLLPAAHLAHPNQYPQHTPSPRLQIRLAHPEYFKDGDITLVCMASTDGMCPFKDKKAISLWPFVLTVLNLPLSMRYHCKNALFVSVGSGSDNRQPANFATHHYLVVDDLIEAAQGWDIEVDGVTRRVRVIVPVFSCDGRGQTARTCNTPRGEGYGPIS